MQLQQYLGFHLVRVVHFVLFGCLAYTHDLCDYVRVGGSVRVARIPHEAPFHQLVEAARVKQVADTVPGQRQRTNVVLQVADRGHSFEQVLLLTFYCFLLMDLPFLLVRDVLLEGVSDAWLGSLLFL